MFPLPRLKVSLTCKFPIHPALILSRSQHSRLGLEGGMTSDRSDEQFSSRFHVNVYYKNHYDRNEIAPV